MHCNAYCMSICVAASRLESLGNLAKQLQNIHNNCLRANTPWKEKVTNQICVCTLSIDALAGGPSQPPIGGTGGQCLSLFPPIQGYFRYPMPAEIYSPGYALIIIIIRHLNYKLFPKNKVLNFKFFRIDQPLTTPTIF